MYRIERALHCGHSFVEILKTLELNVIRIRNAAHSVAKDEKYNRHIHFINCGIEAQHI